MKVRFWQRGQVFDHKRIDCERVIFARSYFESGDLLYFRVNAFEVCAIEKDDIIEIIGE